MSILKNKMAGSAGKRLKPDDFCDISETSENVELAVDIKKIFVILNGINKKLDDLPKITAEIKMINDTIVNIKSDLNKHECQINENKDVIDSVKCDVNVVTKSIKNLEERIEYFEQQKRNLNLTISNVPQISGKSDEFIVQKVLDVLEVNSNRNNSDFYNARRLINKTNINITPQLIFTCSNIAIKNAIIDKYISCKTSQTFLTLKKLGLSDLNENVYIGEHLTQKNNEIFYLARKARKYEPTFFLSVFSRNGRVHIKTRGNTKYTSLNTKEDLFELCSDNLRAKLLQQHNNMSPANQLEDKTTYTSNNPTHIEHN